MSIGAIGGSVPYTSPQAAEKSQGGEEMTTITILQKPKMPKTELP